MLFRSQMNCYEIIKNEVKCWDNLGNSFWIDIDDLERVRPYYFSLHGSDGYFSTIINKKRVYLHRFIMNAPKDMVVDHVNHLREDNRKCNLRVCTKNQNNMNLSCKGYYFNKKYNKWQAYITLDGKRKSLGTFEKEVDAKEARKNAEKEYFKDFAQLRVDR